MNIIKSYKESNHYKHFWCGLGIAFALTILPTIGAAFACEDKDKAWGGKFDWSDIAWTIAGGTVGQLLQILTIVLILKN